MGLVEGVTEVADSEEEPFTSSPVELIKTNTIPLPSQSNLITPVTIPDENETRELRAPSQSISHDTSGPRKSLGVDAEDTAPHAGDSDSARPANPQHQQDLSPSNGIGVDKEQGCHVHDIDASSLQAESRHQANAEPSKEQDLLQSSTSRDPTDNIGAADQEALAEALPDLTSDTAMTREPSQELQFPEDDCREKLETPRPFAESSNTEQSTSTASQHDPEQQSGQQAMQQQAFSISNGGADNVPIPHSASPLENNATCPSIASEEACESPKRVQEEREENTKGVPLFQNADDVDKTTLDLDRTSKALHSTTTPDYGHQNTEPSQELAAPKPGHEASIQDIPEPDRSTEAPTTTILAPAPTHLTDSKPESASPTKPSSPTNSPTPPKTTQETTLAELKAQRTALLASLAALPNIQHLIAESNSTTTSQPPASESTNEQVMAAANKLVKQHIKLLHEYNEIKDAGQGLMGLIADQRGVRIVEVQDEFGIGAQD
ncbi:hypothetical protein K491DRAFT_713074 [Lophiostoma macrostomum CBS 122681]|uniref:Swi5-domain-containing protein n=1 Tax=Lophiostoma macrostomum CBS 122681 TaxID=1314788 RepID=A0A6A6TKB4_9PLEO|nr:hypothetical protein K491DRAFT_713074 [Lophiostoma macrostomum CBS 122681]